MRKISSQMCQAIANNKDWHSGNTKVVTTTEGYSHVYLHDNHIATVSDNNVVLYDGGRQTATTKERLNAILDMFGATGERVYQRAYQWYVRVNNNGTQHDVPFVNGFTFA